ncbi:uncharacterized protein METZ01_LOCUS495708, partial [marine metagenome]
VPGGIILKRFNALTLDGMDDYRPGHVFDVCFLQNGNQFFKRVPLVDFAAVPVEGFEFSCKVMNGQSLIQGGECLYFIIINYNYQIVQSVSGSDQKGFPCG